MAGLCEGVGLGLRLFFEWFCDWWLRLLLCWDDLKWNDFWLLRFFLCWSNFLFWCFVNDFLVGLNNRLSGLDRLFIDNLYVYYSFFFLYNFFLFDNFSFLFYNLSIFNNFSVFIGLFLFRNARLFLSRDFFHFWL